MPGRSIRRVVLALGLGLVACEPPTDPLDVPPRRLVIHAVLDAGKASQTVLVQYLDGNSGHHLTTVSGAAVSITAPGGAVYTGTLVVEESPSSVADSYYSVMLPLSQPVVPGGTYTLRVRTPAGEEATGTTTVPTSNPVPGFEFDSRTFDRAQDTLRLSWRRVPLAARYQVMIERAFVFDSNRTSYEEVYRAFVDTSFTLAGTARTLENERVFVPGNQAWIFVAAVDDNYYTYYHATFDPFAGAPPSRLTGAIGVFGSMVPVRRLVLNNVR